MNSKHITKEDINQTGNVLLGKASRLSKDDANSVLKQFRENHLQPMTLLRDTIERTLKKHNIDAIVSQRLKRIPSIIKKLELQKSMKLSRMQDIAGTRVIVNTIAEVNLIRDELRKIENHSDFQFTFANEKNYIIAPPPSGYRSLHLVYKYDKNVPLDEQCRIEIQLRTKLHHSWATAVEVAGTYLRQPLKQSIGNEQWLEIFKDISDLFIMFEKASIDHNFVAELKQKIDEEKLLEKLSGFTMLTDHIAEENNLGKYLLITMNFKNKKTYIEQYESDNFEKANNDYLAEELKYIDNNEVEVVLLSVQDINNLQKAYPNYFMDTIKFLYNLDLAFKLSKALELASNIKDDKTRLSMIEFITYNIQKSFNK